MWVHDPFRRHAGQALLHSRVHREAWEDKTDAHGVQRPHWQVRPALCRGILGCLRERFVQVTCVQYIK